MPTTTKKKKSTKTAKKPSTKTSTKRTQLLVQAQGQAMNGGFKFRAPGRKQNTFYHKDPKDVIKYRAPGREQIHIPKDPKDVIKYPNNRYRKHSTQVPLSKKPLHFFTNN